MIGLLGPLQLQQPQVALLLALPQGGVLVADMLDDHVRKADFDPEPAQGRQDLLVHAMFPAELRMPPEEPHMIYGGGTSCRRQAEAFHRIGRLPFRQAGEQAAELLAVRLIEPVVGVHPEDPVPGRMVESHIARRRKAIHPGKVNHPRPEARRNLLRSIR